MNRMVDIDALVAAAARRYGVTVEAVITSPHRAPADRARKAARCEVARYLRAHGFTRRSIADVLGLASETAVLVYCP